MGNPAQRKYADRLEFMESIGFRYEVIATSRLWQLRQYVDQRPVKTRIGMRTDPIGNLIEIQPTHDGWVLKGVSLDAPKHAPFPHAIEAFTWWVEQQTSR